ncbi:hypothetical protein H4W32_008980 [Actinophytocola algeriensis]|uniref:Uncharacterized protein n=1 Tax=Actinophytocola algeriensis TaxID=1768010 RepID=A0A7W7QFE4_9PSEU|nr:hypothetical protein [Actinophytocola algeriensis]MBE1480938.1 hypothetical protein [Actinophytocola algeriensis]
MLVTLLDVNASRVQEQDFDLGARFDLLAQGSVWVVLAQQVQRQARYADVPGTVEQAVWRQLVLELRPGRVDGHHVLGLAGRAEGMAA